MKKFFFYAAALCMTAVGFTACTAEDEVFPAPQLSVSVESTNVAATGGAVAFNLTAPTGETYSVDLPEWIVMNEDATVSRGVNTTSDLNFVVAPAVSCQERTGQIRITSASGMVTTHEVVQDGIQLAVSVKSLSLTGGANTVAVKLTAADGYTVELPEWITMVEDYTTTHDAAQTVEVHFNVTSNTGNADRQGEIVFSCCETCGQKVTISVSQLAKEMFYAGKMFSYGYEQEFDNTLRLVWDAENPLKVRVYNIVAGPVGSMESGDDFNYVEAEYYPDGNFIAIEPGTSLHISNTIYVNTNTADMEGDIFKDYGYLVFNADMTELYMPYCFLVGYERNDGYLGMYEAFAGDVTFERVTK